MPQDENDLPFLQNKCTALEINEWLWSSVSKLNEDEKEELVSDAPASMLEYAKELLEEYDGDQPGHSFDHGIHEFLAIIGLVLKSCPDDVSEEVVSARLSVIPAFLGMPDILANVIEVNLENGSVRLKEKIEFIGSPTP